MTLQPPKIQLGLRLPETIVRQIDAARNTKPRAEFCRELIEQGLRGAESSQPRLTEEMSQTLESLGEQRSEIRRDVALAQRDAAQTLCEIRNLREDFATAIVGVLTKIGQVVRDEDRRPFARKEAEDFVTRVLLTRQSEVEDAR